MKITKTVGLSETTVERLAEEIDGEIAALAAEGLAVVDVRYQPCVVPDGGMRGDIVDWYTALLLIGEAS